MTKCPPKGRGQVPGAEFLNFKPPYVNLERVKLETSNSVGYYYYENVYRTKVHRKMKNEK